MIIRKLVAGMLLVLGPMIGTAHAVAKENYRPYAHAYPQIIQEHDYSTIEGIEGLLTELKKLPKGDLSCTLSKDSISL